jgi:hypothetical protein
MDKVALFETWAPPRSTWSPWAKPVLFAHYPIPLPTTREIAHDLSWVPPATEHSALVVDLPGAEAVAVGVALAEKGYRPVPVFNACPPPISPPADFQLPYPQPPLAAVNVELTLSALVHYADHLQTMSLPPDAPPAFLVDARRQGHGEPITPKTFDNRSVLFATDFPSANFLVRQLISHIFVVSSKSAVLEQDLTFVLRQWQQAGLAVQAKYIDDPHPPRPLTIGGRWFLYSLLHHLWALVSLQRHPGGGYGGFRPEPISG